MNWLKSVMRANSAAENVFALIVAMLAFGGAFFAAVSLLKVGGLLTAEIAAWVQAFGAIAAIAAAWKLAHTQLELQNADKSKERRLHMRAFVDLITRLGNNGVRTADTLEKKKTVKVRLEDARNRLHPMKVALETLERIEWHQAPFVYIATQSVSIANSLGWIIKVTEEIVGGHYGIDVEFDRDCRRIRSFASTIQRELEAIEALVTHYNGDSDHNIMARHL